MRTSTSRLRALRDAGAPQIYFALTGGGSGLVQRLCAVPGISRVFRGATIPYAQAEVDDFLGFTPESHCSAEAAVDLAQRAYLHAWSPGQRAVGIGLTAVIATLAPHRGDHRVFCAAFSDGSCRLWRLKLRKGTGTAARRSDDRRCEELGLTALFAADGTGRSGEPADALARERLLRLPLFTADGRRVSGPPDGAAFFPGTFDPPHFGHAGVAESLRQTTGRAPIFAITLDPPHKAPLTNAEILQRVKLLHGRDVLFSSGDRLFLDKARRWPGATFVLGSDALVRLLDPSWCPTEPMLEELRRLGVRFYVVGRDVPPGTAWFDGLPIPQPYRGLFTLLPGDFPISSTELRRRAAATEVIPARRRPSTPPSRRSP